MMKAEEEYARAIFGDRRWAVPSPCSGPMAVLDENTVIRQDNETKN